LFKVYHAIHMKIIRNPTVNVIPNAITFKLFFIPEFVGLGVGLDDGEPISSLVGAAVVNGSPVLGDMEGDLLKLGELLAYALGYELGCVDGDIVGDAVGAAEGIVLGEELGEALFIVEGNEVGFVDELGDVLGDVLGDMLAVGDVVGDALVVGYVVGGLLGDAVGGGCTNSILE